MKEFYVSAKLKPYMARIYFIFTLSQKNEEKEEPLTKMYLNEIWCGAFLTRGLPKPPKPGTRNSTIFKKQ